MVNLVTIVGRLTNDVQLYKTNNGISYVRFNLACDRKKKDADGNKKADFPTIKAFGKQAEFIAQYGRKGDVYGVIGHINTERKEKDGKYEYYESIVADSVQSCQTKSNDYGYSVDKQEVSTHKNPLEVDDVNPIDLPF